MTMIGPESLSQFWETGNDCVHSEAVGSRGEAKKREGTVEREPGTWSSEVSS